MCSSDLPHPVTWTTLKQRAMERRHLAEDNNPNVAEVENPKAKGKAMESPQQLPLRLRSAPPRPSLLPKRARRHERPETDDDAHQPDQMQQTKDEKSNVS